MNDQIFEEENSYKATFTIKDAKKGGIIGFFIKSNIAGDEKQANLVIIFLITLCIVSAIGIYVFKEISFKKDKSIEQWTQEEIEENPTLYNILLHNK